MTLKGIANLLGEVFLVFLESLHGLDFTGLVVEK